uniref:Ig-like domain-containing protein n=1 Tax=Phasianus colchicus TaxID=9054 RepID=A0A669QFM1_PHACC
MTPMALALILGGCAGTRLTAVPYPSAPTLPVTAPSQGVSLGENVTLRCHLPHPAAWVWLYQEGHQTYRNYKYMVQDTADFSFLNMYQEHAGRYFCQYQESWSAEDSEKSDPVELVLTGEGTGDSRWFCLLPTGPCPTMGTNVTIQCWNKDYGAAFLLHLHHLWGDPS